MYSRFSVALAVVSLAVAGCGEDAPTITADAVYVNGTVITMNDVAPRAEAVAVKDGRILAVGTRADIEARVGEATEVNDLAGATLLPGFIDSHGHLSMVGMIAVAANLGAPPDGAVRSIADLQQELRNWMATSDIPAKYGLVIGWGYDESQLAEQRHPTRDDLDAVSDTLPIYVVHQSGHLGAGNSVALAQFGIDATTPDPEGGVIRRRDGSDEPNGVFEETAHNSMAFGLLTPNLIPGEGPALIDAAQELYASFGYTTAQDGAVIPANIDDYTAAAEAGRLKLDVVAYAVAQMLGDSAFMSGPYAGRDYRNRFRIGGIKLTLDGSPQGKTAWLSQPYFVPPPGQDATYAGYPIIPDEALRGYIGRAYDNGWQVLAHTNGDAAVEQLLDAVDDVSEGREPADRRTVSIHAQTARADQLDRMKALGILPSFFTAHTFYWGDWHRDSVLGPDRAENISPTGWALERGMRFTAHHDTPVIPPNSMRVLASTVNRTTRSGRVIGAAHRVDPEIALKAMTSWAAWQNFEEDDKGTIEAGKLADLVVLSQDPTTVDPAAIGAIRVLETIKEGRTVYRAEGP
ncbi:MAG: amidohydrolase [Gammaproteobacteria bacterium]|nr:amidohydrolase [Gammaproteobacteria bacterium]MDH4255523.1 amidohydrolase [Gammaproteobacteria bacterium]MDH5311289.1 amidohydrolase [Gammaproteobacteria bacterium]